MNEPSLSRLLGDLRQRLSPRLRALLDQARATQRTGADRGEPPAPSWEIAKPEAMRDRRPWIEEIRARSAQLVEEIQLARGLLAELLEASPTERLRRVEAEPRCLLLTLAKYLLVESRRRSADDPAEGESLAQTALAITRRLDPYRYERSLRNDFQAQAWSEIGNARRMAGDHAGAERALRRAADLLQDTRDGLELARLLNRKAALRRDQQRLDEAIRLGERALKIYRRFGDLPALERTLTRLGEDYLRAGQPEKASAVRGKAENLLDPS